MSNYIPTTEEIREAYVIYSHSDACCREHSEIIIGDQAEVFDRWLKMAKAEAWNEGWRAGYSENEWGKQVPNPYREGETPTVTPSAYTISGPKDLSGKFTNPNEVVAPHGAIIINKERMNGQELLRKMDYEYAIFKLRNGDWSVNQARSFLWEK